MTRADWVEVGSVVVVGLIVALFPLAVIWSLNTLFDTAIGWGWSTWAAVWVLIGAGNTALASTTNVVLRR